MKRKEQNKTFIRHLMMVYINMFKRFNPLSPHDTLKHHLTSLTYMSIFLNFSPTSSHLHEDDNDKFRLEREMVDERAN